MRSTYVFLNYFFFAFHLFLISFILFGWIWKRTRRLNLVVQAATAFSWYVLGIWYGIGYCPLTEWHWQVRYRLGHFDMPASYVKFLLDSLTGMSWNARLVDTVTVVFFGLAVIASVWVNVRDWKNKSEI